MSLRGICDSRSGQDLFTYELFYFPKGMLTYFFRFAESKAQAGLALGERGLTFWISPRPLAELATFRNANWSTPEGGANYFFTCSLSGAKAFREAESEANFGLAKRAEFINLINFYTFGLLAPKGGESKANSPWESEG